MEKIRIGIDFGYKYTGIAILTPDNKVLDCAVIKHKDISGTLLGRRTNRSARRRKLTRKVRLRNFHALLKGMGIDPRWTEGKTTDAEKKFIGNQLYALAHRRGWDYSSLVELLIDEKGGKTKTVTEIDKLLVVHFDAPYTEKTRMVRGSPRVTKEINNTCLGELAAYKKEISDYESKIKKAEKNGEIEKLTEKVVSIEMKYDDLCQQLSGASLGEVKKYIRERLKQSGVDADKEEEALRWVLVHLGLNVGKILHEEGLIYTPHKNRHRNEFVDELNRKMREAFSDPMVQQKAKQQAIQQGTTVEKINEQWKKNATAIMDPNNPDRGHRDRKKNNNDVRPVRFENRHVGKCPAQLPNRNRCNCNLPKKSRQDIRALQFEIEARQMNVISGDDTRKLNDDEVKNLLTCVDFEECKFVENGSRWNEFFENHKLPRVKEDARGKKDILKDIATGGQGGRSGLCRTHLHEKLNLIKTEKTESDAWKRLHQERILSIYRNDAPPSIRQKVEVVMGALIKTFKKNNLKIDASSIEHIGIETARFDISALAQNEGKKLKKPKNYQKKSSRDIQSLKEEQGNKCLYCGHDLGFATIDHIFPKSRGGSDKALNRAAAHGICNINKGKMSVEFAPAVLDSIKLENKKKYNYIQKGIAAGWECVDESLAGAQHTMFGAKLLKGSLIEKFEWEQLSDREIKRIFPKINSRETVLLRKHWFPLMNIQKSVIRYKDNDNITAMKVVIGEKHPKPMSLNKWKTDVAVQLEKPERLKDWMEYVTEKDESGQSITTVSIKSGHTFKQGDECILRYRFDAVSEDTGEIVRYQKIHIIVQPAKNDGINEFHHAVDAIVAATKVDWERLAMVGYRRDVNSKKYRDEFKSIVGSIRPEIELPKTKWNGDVDMVAPNANTFLKVDKQNQSRPKYSKTDTQALSVKMGKITQRKALYEITKNGVDSIQSFRIRSLMKEAFEKIGKMNKEYRGRYLKEGCISQDYFLTLSGKNLLHPKNTRRVRCLVKGTGASSMFKIINKTNKGEHFYKRTVAWAKCVVYKENGKTKLASVRLLDDFYVNERNPQIALPEGAVVVDEFARGDLVKIEKIPGIWKISKLGTSATLLPHDEKAQNHDAESRNKGEQSAAYTKLTK